MTGFGSDGGTISPAALTHLQALIARALSKMPVGATDFAYEDGSVEVTLTRASDASGGGTVIRTSAGSLSFARLRVDVEEKVR